MSIDIQATRNMNFRWSTLTTPGEYTQQISKTFNPDQAIVRQITYLDIVPQTSTGLYFIWSSLTNDYIGSFTVANNTYTTAGATIGQSGFVSNPQSILCNLSVPNNVSFRIDQLVAGQYVAQSTLSGNINILIEFVKFRA